MLAKRLMLLCTVVVLVVGGGLIGCVPAEPDVEYPRGPDGYPTRPIQILVGFGLGGGTDRAARAVGHAVEEILGMRFAYINLAGASGSVAEDYLIRQPADGYSILCTPAVFPVNILLGRNENTLDDYVPIARMQQDVGQIQINAKDPRFSNVEEFVAYARENRVTIGGMGGVGALDHTATMSFAMGAGFFDNLDMVDYAAAGEMQAAVVAGDIDACYEEPGPAIGLIEAGELKPMITFHYERIEGFEDVPTARELGYTDIDLYNHRGFIMRAGVDPAIVAFLEEIFEQAYYSDFYQQWEREAYLHYAPGFAGSEEYMQQLRDETLIYEGILKQLGVI